MEKLFELQLTNQYRAGWLAFGFTVGTTAIMVGGIVALLDYGAAVTLAVLFSLGGGLIYGFIRLMKTLAIEPSLVTIAADRITVLNRKSDEVTQLPFHDIASYQYSVYRGGQQLSLKRKGATSLKLSDNSPAFTAMVLAFEAALLFHQQPEIAAQSSLETGGDYAPENHRPNDSPLATIREKSFFEKPISTVVMVALSVGMVLLTFSVFLSSRPVKGSLILAYSGYISYATTWYINRLRLRK